jgi:hypothetical protein
MNIKIECVWCNTKSEFNKFVRTYDDISYVINHVDVAKKIKKNNDSDRIPSDNLIGLHIHNQLKMYNSKLYKFDNHPKTIIYLIKRLDKQTAEGLKSTLNRVLITDSIEYNLNIINRDDYTKRGVLSYFDHVKFIDK